MKLERIERHIEFYDLKTEDLVEEILLAITLDDLENIIQPKEDDPLFYDGYELTENQVQTLITFAVSFELELDFDKFYCVLTCTGIYTWDSLKTDTPVPDTNTDSQT
jgi:hypothetical protein